MRVGTITTLGHWKLGYTFSVRGQRLRRPWRIERAAVQAWNWIACRVVGHDRSLDGIDELCDADGTFPCTSCSARLIPRIKAAGTSEA